MLSAVKLTRAVLSKVPGNVTYSAKPLVARAMSSVRGEYKYETLKVSEPKEFVYNVELHRPDKLNAMNRTFWREMVECFQQINADQDCRVIILSGSGRLFTAGLDLTDFTEVISGSASLEPGRKAFAVRDTIINFQESFTVIEKCTKPVICAIHNACIGGGVNMITAADMRYCTQDAYFVVKEVDLGLAADVGVLQRLPKVIGNDSLARELCYTGRKLMADEAKECGLVSRVFPNKDEMMGATLDTASLIASKSPIAVQGTKVNMVYSRDHSVPDGLKFMAAWNQGMLQSEDVVKSAMASMQKTKAEFSKL